MTRSRKIMSHSMPALLLALLIAVSFAPCAAYADDPDFSTDDPLDGQWELSRVTDLMLYQSHQVQVNGVTKSKNYVYYLDTEDNQIGAQTARLVVDPPCWLLHNREPQITRSGRFFALGYDVVVTLSPSLNAGGSDCASTNGFSNMGLYVMDAKTSDVYWTHLFFGPYDTAMAMNDFNADGFEDVFVINNTEALVATATDLYDPSMGMTTGARTELGSPTLAPLWDPVSADFNNDGLMDVAWIGQDHTLYFASVCPGSVAGTPCAGKAALDVVLNPLNTGHNVITPPDANCWDYGSGNGLGAGQALAAGNFFVDTSEPAEQYGRLVALGCAQPSSGWRMRAYSYKFASDMTVTQQQFIDIARCQMYCGSVYAEGARLEWSSAAAQVAFTYANVDQVYVNEPPYQQYLVGVVSFNGVNMESTFDLFEQILWVVDQSGLLGLATGHFSAIPDDASNPEAFNLQIAVALNNSPTQLYIFTVDPPGNYKPVQASVQQLSSSLGILVQDSAFNKLVAGDLQGRSDRLGSPTKIAIATHLQPAVVLGAPPMHADYVLPNQQTALDPSIMNFTAAPLTYNTQYAQGGSTTSTSSRTDTTSYSYSYAESTSEKFSF